MMQRRLSPPLFPFVCVNWPEKKGECDGVNRVEAGEGSSLGLTPGASSAIGKDKDGTRPSDNTELNTSSTN